MTARLSVIALCAFLTLAAARARGQQDVVGEPAVSGGGLVLDALAGLALPEDLLVLGEPVTGAAASAVFGARYEIPVCGRLDVSPRLETILLGRRGRIGAAEYRSRSVRFGGGVQVGLRPQPGWRFATGFHVRNERDVEDWDVRRIRNVRFAARLTAAVELSPRWMATAVFERTLGSGSDSRFLSDPRRRVDAGVSYRLRPARS